MLEGRICLITGASSGIGAHLAKALSAEGAKMVLAARRLDRVKALADSLQNDGHAALAVEMDVTDEASVIAAYDTAETALGTVDTIIANAGTLSSGRSTDVPAKAVRGIFDTNLLGVYLTAREGAKRMIAAGSRETGRGRIVLLGSITAIETTPGEAAYAASKAGVAHLGRNLAREWVRTGVNVNVIQPGYIQTELSGDWFRSEQGKQQIEGFHRRRMQPIESLDPLVTYLASHASAAMTGAVITLDDGQSL